MEGDYCAVSVEQVDLNAIIAACHE
jgi:hypothetical protein